MSFACIKDVDVSGKRIVVRTGFDLPVDEEGNILDAKRIDVCLPTIRFLLEHGASRLVLMWHMGRPKNNEEKLKTDKAAALLAQKLGEQVVKIDDWGELGLPDAKIIALENLRFHASEKSKDAAERDAFGKHLASLGDIYVNEAFSNCHRDHASMTSVTKFIPGYVGLFVEDEYRAIRDSVENPQRPLVVVFGGMKADKIAVMDHLLEQADHVLVAGTLAFLFLYAKGYQVGMSKIDKEGFEADKEHIMKLAAHPKLVLPSDCIVATELSATAQASVTALGHIRHEQMALDLGPVSIEYYKQFIKDAKTILWFGPIGAFEFPPFAKGTEEIAKAVAASDAYTVIGGGDSASAVKNLGLTDKMNHVSSGGGASLKLVSGDELVAIKALHQE